MSFSTLMQLEACPRKWALASADYPEIWSQSGYPSALNTAAIEGSIIHKSLEILTKAFADQQCSSLSEARAMRVIKELGGYTPLLQRCADAALKPYSDNPRAKRNLEQKKQIILSHIPEIRIKLQNLLSRIQLFSQPIGHKKPLGQRDNREKSLGSLHGSYSEIELRVPEMRWRGFVDLLTLTSAICEIRDYKTGKRKDEDREQICIYALLWWRENRLNSAKRLADRLVVSYRDGDECVVTPTESELVILEEALLERTKIALATAKETPPKANVSEENCIHCNVRQLCEEYWESQLIRASVSESFDRPTLCDLQVFIKSQHGPMSWDGEVLAGSLVKAGQPILLRTTMANRALQIPSKVRLLNVHVAAMNETNAILDEINMPVATLTKNSEVFELVTNAGENEL